MQNQLQEHLPPWMVENWAKMLKMLSLQPIVNEHVYKSRRLERMHLMKVCHLWVVPLVPQQVPVEGNRLKLGQVKEEGGPKGQETMHHEK